MNNYFFVISIVFVFLFIGSISMASTSHAQFQNLEGIELKVTNWKKIESTNSDALVLTVMFSNNGDLASDMISEYIFLVDSQDRKFGPSAYYELKEKGLSVSTRDCPMTFMVSVNPDLSQEKNICYEVPKGIGSSLSLDVYNTIPDLCDEPYFACDVKSFPFTLKSQNSPTSSAIPKIPDWVRNTMQWYLDGSISENEMISAIQYLVNEGIIKLN